MNKLNAFMQEKYNMKSFIHAPETKQIPILTTETINGKRFYVVDGEKYPSITTVLSERNKEGLVRWRKSVGNEVANNIMRTAAKRGTAVHTLVENYLDNKELSKQDVLPLALFTLLKPSLDNINSIRIQEGSLYSNKWKVAGRVDCIAEFAGEVSVIDFKTSTKRKTPSQIKGYYMQETAYAKMFEEMYNIPINRIVTIVAVEETGESQMFVEEPKHWIDRLKDLRNQYRDEYGI